MTHLWTLAGSVLTATLSLSTPLIFAADGGVISERSGVLNIGLEGMTLAGAFGYFLGGHLAHSAPAAVAAAMIVGALMAVVLTFLNVTLGVDQVIGGLAVNLMAAGGTAFLYRSAFGLTGSLSVPGIANWHVPGLSRLPLIGPILFQQSPLTYAALVAVILTWLFFRHTRPGLWLRATGEHPEAVESAGLSVRGLRTLAVVASGLSCGLGGAFLVSQVQNFTENMTAGVGFIALAAVIFGKWDPAGALWASLFFGLFQSLQTALQVTGVRLPYQFLLMVPYVVTIVVLAGFVGQARAPAADGKPYRTA